MFRLLRAVASDVVGQRRYRLAAYSTAANIASKALSAVVLYLSVSLTISYLGDVRFGIWMTLASTISLFGFLDFGIGSSLLNQVSLEAASGSAAALRRIITHGLLLLTAIGCLLVVILLPVAYFIPWGTVVRTPGLGPELRTCAFTLVVLIGAGLPITGLVRVIWGLQRTHVYYVMVSVGRLVSLALLFVLAGVHAHIAALIWATYGVQLLFSLPLLMILIRERLVWDFDSSRLAGDTRVLLRYGAGFFLIALGGAVAWDADNVIIAQFLGAAAVAEYAVAVRLFQAVELGLQAINYPLWSAYGDAYARGEHGFLKRLLKRAMALTVVLALVGTSLIVVGYRWLLRIWVHQAVSIPLALIVIMALWYVIRCCGTSFAMYLNGIRVVRTQAIIAVAFCVMAVPLKVFGTMVGDLFGIVAATILAYVVCVILPYSAWLRPVWLRPLRAAQPPMSPASHA